MFCLLHSLLRCRFLALCLGLIATAASSADIENVSDPVALQSASSGLATTADDERVDNNKVFKVAFINPSHKGNSYWDRYVDYMQVAADSLNIELQVEYAKNNRLNAPEIASKLISESSPPDYMIYIYQYGQSQKVLNLAEIAQIKSFIVNTNVTDTEEDLVGKPREKFKFWIGHLHPDNKRAGEILANHLLEDSLAHRRISKEGRVQLLAISGSRDSTAAIDFNEGLSNALKKNKYAELEQLVFSNWYYKTALRQAEGLLIRYPDTQVIWTVGEDVALGAVEGAKLAGLMPGKDIVIGGTVSTSRGVDAIEQGLLTANMGGDSWEGARALVMLYDYHHGIDFADGEYSKQYSTHYVTRENVAPFKQLITYEKWKDINYRRMSRYLNPDIKHIEFDVNTLLQTTY